LADTSFYAPSNVAAKVEVAKITNDGRIRRLPVFLGSDRVRPGKKKEKKT